MSAQRCKGTNDLSPDEMRRFRLIEGAFRDACLKWGYEEVRTPTLEYLHLFTSTGTLTPDQLHKVYSFLDWDGWSGERVVLRPDGTIPIARLYIETMEKKGLAKLFYVTNVFSFEETGKETRERWQGGAELIGAGSIESDIELVLLAVEVLKKLEIEDIGLSLSHAGLIKALLKKFDLSAEEQTRVLDQVLSGDTAALARLKSKNPDTGKSLSALLDLKGKSAGFLKNMRTLCEREMPELLPSLDNFISFTSLLESLGVKYQIDIASGKGFEYYTGVMFQLYSCGEPIGGGGRYDALIPLMGGKNTPASGFALYIDHLMSMIKPEVLNGHAKPVILIKPGEGASKEAFNLVTRLHEAGYSAEIDLGGRKPGAPGWTIDVQSKAPRFTVADHAKHKKSQAQTEDEVMGILHRS